MSCKLVIIGAGGLGVEAAWAAAEMSRIAGQSGTELWNIAGFADDDATKAGTLVSGYPVIGSLSQVAEILGHDVFYHCAIGSNAVRQKLVTEAEALGWTAATVIHPSASIAENTTIGEGTYVAAGVCICPTAKLGKHVIVNMHASIAHDTLVKDYAQLCPGVRVSGFCQIGEHAFLGSNASVAPKKTVGAFAKVAAGSAVLRNVKPNSIVVGVPAEPFACATEPTQQQAPLPEPAPRQRILLSVSTLR